uniref:Uncharacterized protein n=1 Tax=Oryzias latipes TaxID=8090 RepID=A0A3B3I3C6_ORYLA
MAMFIFIFVPLNYLRACAGISQGSFEIIMGWPHEQRLGSKFVAIFTPGSDT